MKHPLPFASFARRLAVAALAVAAAGSAGAEPSPAPWWRAWRDEALSAWIEAGLARHPSLDAAAGAVRRARAARSVAAAAGRPASAAELTARFGRRQTAMSGADDETIPPVELAAGMTWEADLFGRIAARVRSADARREAAEADRRGAELVLAAEIAAVYFDLARLGGAVPRARRMEEVSRELAGWSRRRAAAGLLAPYEADDAAVEADTMARAARDLDRQRAEAEALRAALVGGDIPDAPAALASMVLPDPPDADGGRRAVLRPDVVRVFAYAAAADSAADAERKERLPTISLLARAAFEGGRGGSDRAEWSAWVGPRISLPFGDPRLRPMREMAEAERDAVSAEARAVLLDAVREIEGALAWRRQAAADLTLADRQATTLRRTADSIRRRAEAGLATSGETLAADLRSLAAEDDAEAARRATHAAHVLLLRALGG